MRDITRPPREGDTALGLRRHRVVGWASQRQKVAPKKKRFWLVPPLYWYERVTGHKWWVRRVYVDVCGTHVAVLNYSISCQFRAVDSHKDVGLIGTKKARARSGGNITTLTWNKQERHLPWKKRTDSEAK
jgi:hypothetical protein